MKIVPQTKEGIHLTKCFNPECNKDVKIGMFIICAFYCVECGKKALKGEI